MAANFQADQKITEIAEAYSLDAVDIAAENFRVTLDWSDDSVRLVEQMLGQLHDQMRSAKPSEDTIWTFAKAFGSYVGEVLRRRHGGQWGMVLLNGESYPGLQRTGGELIWPWSRAQKRIVNGPEDNIWHYYKIVTRERASVESTAKSTPQANPPDLPASQPKKPWWKFW